MGNTRNRARKCKRIFRGNQFVVEQEEYSTDGSGSMIVDRPTGPASSLSPVGGKRAATDASTPFSRSSKKRKQFEAGELTGEEFFWFFMHSQILKNLIDMVGVCKRCKATGLNLMQTNKRKGYALNICIFCSKCDWKWEFDSSPTIKNDNSPGSNMFCINLLVGLAFREIGKGHEAMKKFNACLNMPPPFTYKTYSNINGKLALAYETVAKECLLSAAEEVRKTPLTPEAEIEDCQVTIDGTWQKRGHSSLNGVVAATSSKGKVIDFHVLTKSCKSCQIWESRRDRKISQLEQIHKCPINHTKSAGAMEAAGAVSIFKQSVDKYKLRYRTYIGDGDTDSFGKVVEAKPYGDILPVKLECVGHVQKRLGTRLRQLRKDCKGKKLGDGKGLTGRGRLTDKCINTLQNYYGMAIRQNTNNLYAMKKSIGAVLFHCSDISNETVRHQFCPRTGHGWCKWQNDQINKTQTFRKKINLPNAIKTVIEPIFRDLSSDELLMKCLHGQTQNCNEAFNGVLWSKCPKQVFVGKETLEIAVCSAVINYNNGFSKLQSVYRCLGLPIGYWLQNGFVNKDEQCRKQREKSHQREKRREEKS